MKSENITWAELRNSGFLLTIILGGVFGFNVFTNKLDRVIQTTETTNRDLVRVINRQDQNDLLNSQQNDRLTTQETKMGILENKGLLSKAQPTPVLIARVTTPTPIILHDKETIKESIVAQSPSSGASAERSPSTPPTPNPTPTQGPSGQFNGILPLLPTTGIPLIDNLL